MSNSRTLTGRARRGAERTTRVVLGVSLVMSLLVTLGVAARAVGAVTRTLASGTVHTDLYLEAPLPAEASGPQVDLVSGSFEQALVEVSDVPTAALVLQVAAVAVGALVALLLAATVAVLAHRLLRGRPLARRLGRTVGVAGGTVMLGSLLAAGLDVAATFALVDALNAPAAGPDGFWPHAASADFTGIGIGFALMLVGMVFEQGEALQRDTEGLI